MPRKPADGSTPAEIVYVELDVLSTQQRKRGVRRAWKGTLLDKVGLWDMMAKSDTDTVPQPLASGVDPFHLVEEMRDGRIVVTTQGDDARGRRIRDPRKAHKPGRAMTRAQAFKHGRRWAGRRYRFLKTANGGRE